MTLPPFPAMAEAPTPEATRRPLAVPSLDAPSGPREQAPRPRTRTPMPIDPVRTQSPESPASPSAPLPVEYTDADLSAALAPLVPASSSPNAFPDDFEAALRSAMRRTLAQHIGSPFDDPAILQRTLWRFDALFSSRSYEEVVQEKTGRFRIEELYLMESDRLTMISFASVDPARHVSPHKVHPTADRIAAQARIEGKPAPTEFALKDGLKVLIRQVGDLVLAAVVRGQPDALVDADLDYALQRIKKAYGTEITAGAPLLVEIQPLLEECLLIHSPLAPMSR